MRYAKLTLLAGAIAACALAEDARMFRPQYNAAGELLRPRDYAEWVAVGSSIGLSYSATPVREAPGLIHQVQIQPEAYRQFKATGQFPDKTVLILSLYKPEQKVSPSLHGHFMGDLVATEVAVKDKTRFKEGWAYFDFRGGEKLLDAAAAQPADRCHACHVKNARTDNVFTQFYPALRK